MGLNVLQDDFYRLHEKFSRRGLRRRRILLLTVDGRHHKRSSLRLLDRIVLENDLSVQGLC